MRDVLGHLHFPASLSSHLLSEDKGKTIIKQLVFERPQNYVILVNLNTFLSILQTHVQAVHSERIFLA